MSRDARSLTNRLDALATDLAGGRVQRSRLWGGADIVITTIPPVPRTGDGFYPEPRYVVTPFAFELSWLFECLRDCFAGMIDYVSKYEFYGRLADAAERYGSDRSVEHQTSSGLLDAVICEARSMANQLQSPEAGSS